MKPSGYDQETDCVSKSTANLGAVYPQGPIGARLRDFVTRTAAISTQPSPRLPSGYDTESDLLSKACYNLGGGTPTGSAYDRLYAIVQATGATNVTLLAGLLAFWPLATDANDAHASNDLTPNGDDIQFEGGYAVITGGQWFDLGSRFNLSAGFTAACWSKNANANGIYAVAMSQWQGGFDGFYLGGLPTNQYSGAVSGAGSNVSDAASIPAGAHHLALTYDGNTQKLYVDGLLKAALTFGAMSVNALATFKIGTLDEGGEFNYNGQINRAGLWSRALTASEITALYSGGGGLGYESF